MKMDERSRIGEDTVSFVDYYWLSRTSSPQPRPKITTCSQIYKDISGVPNKNIASLTAHNFWSTWNFGFKFLEYRFQLVFYLKLCVKFCPSPKTWGKWQCLTNFISLKKSCMRTKGLGSCLVLKRWRISNTPILILIIMGGHIMRGRPHFLVHLTFPETLWLTVVWSQTPNVTNLYLVYISA